MAVHPWYLLDLCSGGGMFGVAAHLALGDVRTVAYVEREASAAASLVARMEDKALDRAPIWDDVKTATDPEFVDYVRQFRPLIIVGGYPCQPFSVAGRRAGVNDPRHLWPAIDQLIAAVEPELCFFENVSDHLGLGFAEVRRNLKQRGYSVTPGLFSAGEVGAPQERERLYFLAVANAGSVAGAKPCDKKTSERRDYSGGDSGRGSLRMAQLGITGHTGGRETSVGGEAYPAGPERLQQKNGAESPDRVGTTGRGLAGLGGASGERLQGPGEGGDITEIGGGSLGGPITESSGAQMVDLFPPCRDNHAAWDRLLETCPARIEPALPRLADGVAAGLDADRLRISGNGVVTLAASYALVSLASVAVGDR